MNSFKEELQDLSDFVRRFAFWRTLLMIQIGCFMFGLVVSGILIPQNFFAGGLMGISLLIRTLSGDWISLSLLYILLNLPLFLLGYRSFSLRFLVISLMGMGILSLNLEWTEGMNIPTREPLLAAILGGILSGAGSGLYLRFGGSVGGLDILGAFLKKKFSIPIGNTFILVNLVIIAAKTDPSLGARGVSLIVAEVDDNTPGFERGRILEKVGQKGDAAHSSGPMTSSGSKRAICGNRHSVMMPRIMQTT